MKRFLTFFNLKGIIQIWMLAFCESEQIRTKEIFIAMEVFFYGDCFPVNEFSVIFFSLVCMFKLEFLFNVLVKFL